jgi:hypothetical protein
MHHNSGTLLKCLILGHFRVKLPNIFVLKLQISYDVDLMCDYCSGLHLIASHHDDFNASLLALLN